MKSRFVILHHKTADGEHWDLMLECGAVLLTWQLEREPVKPDSFPIPAHRIADHRKAYLEYEGPISGNRGSVRRVDEGEVQFEESPPSVRRVRLLGRRLSGRISLPEESVGWAQWLSSVR